MHKYSVPYYMTNFSFVRWTFTQRNSFYWHLRQTFLCIFCSDLIYQLAIVLDHTKTIRLSKSVLYLKFALAFSLMHYPVYFLFYFSTKFYLCFSHSETSVRILHTEYLPYEVSSPWCYSTQIADLPIRHWSNYYGPPCYKPSASKPILIR